MGRWWAGVAGWAVSGSTYTVHVIEGYGLSIGSLTQLQLEQVTESGGPPGMTSTIGEQFIYLPPGTVITSIGFAGVLYDPDSQIDTVLTILDGDADDAVLLHEDTDIGPLSTFSALTDADNQPSTLGAMPFTVPFDGAYVTVQVQSADGNALTAASILSIGWA